MRYQAISRVRYGWAGEDGHYVYGPPSFHGISVPTYTEARAALLVAKAQRESSGERSLFGVWVYDVLEVE